MTRSSQNLNFSRLSLSLRRDPSLSLLQDGKDIMEAINSTLYIHLVFDAVYDNCSVPYLPIKAH